MIKTANCQHIWLKITSLFIIFILVASLYFFDLGLFNRLRSVIDYSYIYNSRLSIQIYTLNVIANDLLIGLGHGSMDRIVPVGEGLGPHNTFLHILESGIYVKQKLTK